MPTLLSFSSHTKNTDGYRVVDVCYKKVTDLNFLLINKKKKTVMSGPQTHSPVKKQGPTFVIKSTDIIRG